ncbi:MAG: hypothetical protein JKY93_06965 [Gammaproteobacteria bacterium]|nr:hypothetical protein [Gammaproteobacteria bacterium]
MKKLLLYSLLMVISKSPLAGDLDLSVSGFGHFGWVTTDESVISYKEDIAANTSVKKGRFESKIDSILGLQFNATLGENLNAGAQFVLKDRFNDDDIEDYLQLAYLAFKPHAQVELRAGRLGLPAYMLSDHRDVGFAYLWDRPITEFYGVVPLRYIDGFDVTFKRRIGAGLGELVLFYGDSDATLPIEAISHWDFKVKNFYGIVPKYEQGPWRFQLGLSRTEVDAPLPVIPTLDATFAAARAALPPSSDAAVDALEAEYIDQTNVKGVPIYYYSLGVAYDDNNWVIQSEISRLRSEKNVLSTGHSAYLSVGRRMGSWTPYAVYSFVEPENKPFRSAVTPAFLGPFAPLTGRVEAAVNFNRSKQHSIALGARWDIHPKASLKMQWTHSKVDKDGAALWDSGLGALPSDTSANVYSLGLSFIF